jgi:L,D-transpeptidase ErfK/SrfK
MPKVVPAGPDNPLGRHAIRLALPSYLIHGTNTPWGVGMRVTHGCVRMYPEDIEVLFDRVPVGAAVRIVNQAYKAGWHAGRLYLEIHPVLDEERADQESPLVAAVSTVSNRLAKEGPKVDYARLKQVVAVASGVPAAVTRGPDSDQGDLLSGEVPR